MNAPRPRGPSLRAVLTTHGLADASEERLTNAGFSGAHITRLRRSDGASFILKRMSIERDWIMRATDDVSCRESIFAGRALPLPSAIRTPSIAAARDGDEHALLMHDITGDLLSPGDVPDVDRILRAVASLHTAPSPGEGAVPWCDLARRLTLLTPAGAAIAASYGAPVAGDVVAGWELFERHASPGARRIVAALFDDVAPLVRALDPLPRALLHGDLKFDNIGLHPDGGIWLFDWAMTLLAPAAVDIGWFLAINSRRMRSPLDDAIAAHARYADIAPQHIGRHRALTVLCGLFLRGWRKALDAEAGEPAELRWWCDGAEAAARFL